MAKIKVKANELRDVKVHCISLVKRGASRLPIRIMKGDQAMLDLGGYFTRKDHAQSAQVRKAEADKDEVQKAMSLLQKSGYGVVKLETLKSAPEDDGVSGAPDDQTLNPANGDNPSGPQDDGVSGASDSQKSNPANSAPVTGPQDDGVGGTTVTYTEGAVPLAKAAPEQDTLDTGTGTDDLGEGAVTDTDGQDPSTPELSDATLAKKEPKVRKAEVPSVTLDAIAQLIRSELQKTEDTVGKEIGRLSNALLDLDHRVQKSEVGVAQAQRIVSSIVPAPSSPEASGTVRKSDRGLPPPLDTAYSNGQR